MQHGKTSYLFGLLYELHLPCTAHKKRSNNTPQHEVTFYRGHRLHSVSTIKIQLRCWSSTKRTSSSSHGKGVSMIRVDIGPILETVYIDIILNKIIER